MCFNCADVTVFDGSAFGISSSEAQLMDPQQRLLLECAAEALSTSSFHPAMHAFTSKFPQHGLSLSQQQRRGSSGSRLQGQSLAQIAASATTTTTPSKVPFTGEVGVFVGASYAEYLHLAASTASLSTYTASGGSLSVLAGRVSYLFGLSGPATVTDTACSSSLVALNAAHSSLMVGF